MIQLNTYNQLQRIYKYLRGQKENQKFYKYIEISATFFLVCILLIFAIMPTASAISNLLGEIKSKELLSQKLHAKINSVVLAQDVYSQVQEKYPVIESSLPTYPKLYDASKNLSYISWQNNIPVEQITFDLNNVEGEKISNNITSYGITLTGKGNYNSIVDYIENVLKSRRLVDLKNIRISTENENKLSSGTGINLYMNSNLFYTKN